MQPSGGRKCPGGSVSSNVHSAGLCSGTAADDHQHALLGKLGQHAESDGKLALRALLLGLRLGILLCAILIGLTFGRTDPASPDSFFRNLGSASALNLLYAFIGGIVFNLANLLLVAAIAIAGLAVAFPIGIGLALVIGSVLNYIITPQGNPRLLFGGVALVCAAILVDAMAYRKLAGGGQVTTKGIVLSLLCGIGMGMFYPFVARTLRVQDPGHLGPYTVAFIFALGVLVSNFPLNTMFMRRPVTGPPVSP